MRNAYRNISLWLLPVLCLLAACQQTPAPSGLKLGKPYVVEGKTYYPEYNPTYDKIGQASWYGPGFHGKYTASGEIFNQNDLTAAHPTLPMPSIVRVTNLKNGQSVIVRINDRGPFKSNRIIDLSKRAAEKVGIKSIETVRVQFLKRETDEYLASIGVKTPTMLASNEETITDHHESSDQIVESTVANSHAGQVVSDAAPVMTVSQEDLNNKEEAPEPEETPKIIDASYSPSAGGDDAPQPSRGLIKQAWADDREASLAPPLETSKESDSETKPVAKSLEYYIQAGSFSTEDNAHKLSSKLSGIAPIDIGKVEMGNKTWWRVRLGPFHEQKEANAALETVRASNLPDARIVHQ